MELDFDTCYRALQSRDARFDGRFFTAVTSTGIYCRPICPAQTPRSQNVRFYVSAASAQAAGFRACKRCRPETAPGSPGWNVRADLVGRALRLIAEGAVDTEGVAGLARRLSVSPRHLHRELMAEVGVGPLALARTRRAQTARLLMDGTDMRLTDIAFASGFDSIRQFNETMHDAFGCNPSELRRGAHATMAGNGAITVRLPYRRPFAADHLFDYLGGRALVGMEEVIGNRYRRTVRLGRSSGIVEMEPAPDTNTILLRLRLDELVDLSLVVQRCRQLLDLDVDPETVGQALAADPVLAPLISARPGLRVPGAIDGWELAIRAILGQQVTVAGGRTLSSRLVAALGEPVADPEPGLTHVFPRPEVVAGSDLSGLGITGQRIKALRSLAAAVDRGDLVLDRGADRDEAEAKLLAIPGVGPWTASYIAMRALGDPDAFPAADLGLRLAFQQLGLPADKKSILAHAEAWRPWRAYAVIHFWATLSQSKENA